MDSNTLKGDQTNNPGFQDALDYFNDSNNAFVPDSHHQEHDMGRIAFALVQAKTNLDDIVDNLLPFIPTTDQKDAMDQASAPDASNPFATAQDLANLATGLGFGYSFRTGAGTPADGEVQLDDATPSSATKVRIANIDKDGINVSNNLLKLGTNDAVTIQDVVEPTKVLNYDVSGAVSQVGGTGSGGYVEVPVAFFSEGTTVLVDTDTVVVQLLFDGNNTRFLQKNSNLNDLQDSGAARSNLDVYSTTEVDDLDIALQNQITINAVGIGLRLLVNSNLSDLGSKSAARTNLQLGDSATRNVGSSAGTVSDGAHSHSNLPTTSQKNAMNSADAPSTGNPFVTSSAIAATIGGAQIETLPSGVFSDKILDFQDVSIAVGGGTFFVSRAVIVNQITLYFKVTTVDFIIEGAIYDNLNNKLGEFSNSLQTTQQAFVTINFNSSISLAINTPYRFFIRKTIAVGLNGGGILGVGMVAPLKDDIKWMAQHNAFSPPPTTIIPITNSSGFAWWGILS